MSRDRERKLEHALRQELRAAATPDRDACVDPETLGAWADAGLDAAQMAAVELHVASCPRCQAIVGATARSAPQPSPMETEAPAGFSLWKWWLAPLAAGAAAVTIWMVVPQGENEPAPSVPAPAIEAKKDAAIEPPPPERQVAAAPPAEFNDRRARREQSTGRKQENRVADQAAIGAVASAPAPVAPPAPAAAAPPAVAEATLQSARASTTVEIVSPDSRRRWRVEAGAIERSEDAGASWLQVQNLAPGDNITAGTAPTASICWLIGANGLVWVTADGTTFARVPVPERVALTGITATNARSATVTAADGRRFRTDDSGRNWRRD